MFNNKKALDDLVKAKGEQFQKAVNEFFSSNIHFTSCINDHSDKENTLKYLLGILPFEELRVCDLFAFDSFYTIAQYHHVDLETQLQEITQLRKQLHLMFLPISQISITELPNISKRSVNALKRANIEYIAQLDHISLHRLWKIRNLGKNSLANLLASIQEYNKEKELSEQIIIINDM